MTTDTLPPNFNDGKPLDRDTRAAAIAAVDAAKARGWTQVDLKQWFNNQGVALSDYQGAKAGNVVSDKVRGVLAMISITGLPDDPPGAVVPFANLPEPMKHARRWLLWRSEAPYVEGKKRRKVPYYASGRHRGGTTLDSDADVAELVDYDTAVAVMEAGAFTGLGFALGPDGEGCWQGVDLDAIETHPGLKFIIDHGLPGYVETSPSGKGLHAIGYGRAFASLGSNTTGIEAYAKGRYFTVTGLSVSGGALTCIADFVEQRLVPLHGTRAQDTSAPVERTHDGAGTLAGTMAVPDLQSALRSISSDDRDTWVRMGLALKALGEPGRALWLEWSARSDKYEPQDAAHTWDSFRPTATGYQAVFAEAQRLGWVNPARGVNEVFGYPLKSSVTPRHDPETGEVIEDAPGDGDLFEVLSITDLRALPDAEWIVDKAIPSQGLGFIYGPPGSYKSFICGGLGLALAYGLESWIDRPIKHPGSVLYIANEGAAGLKNRITAWQMANGIDDDTERFRLIRKSMSFMDMADVDRLERTVAAEVETRGPVDTVFVDTVSRVLPGADENLQKDMTVFVQACDRLRERFGATVIGVHHTNKQGEMRGSSVFQGQGDFIFRVEKMDGKRAGILTCEKQKEAEDGWKVAFQMQEHSWPVPGKIEPVGSLSVTFGGTPNPDDGDQWPPRDVCKAMLKEIDEAWRARRPWSPHQRAGTEGRYAVRNLSKGFDIRADVVKMMVEAWQISGIIGFETFDAKAKLKGLKVLQWLD